MGALKRSVHRMLDAEARDSIAELATSVFLAGLVLANVLAVILESVGSLRGRFDGAFAWFEWGSVVVFSVEYVLRVWSCTINPAYSHPRWGRLRFILSPLALVDLVAILPAYLPTTIDLRFARIVRLIRVLKIGRYSRSLQTLGSVLRSRRGDLVVVAALLLILLVLASSSMYLVEHTAQPEAFSSIPAAMWWAITTLTTVGYGDVYPVTTPGRVVGSIIALLGVGFFALPAGILAGAFAEELRRQKATAPSSCPHCGKPLLGQEGPATGRNQAEAAAPSEG